MEIYRIRWNCFSSSAKIALMVLKVYTGSSRLDIDSLQEVLSSHWKPYLENLHVCMTDATCYESHMRFPTDMKLSLIHI